MTWQVVLGQASPDGEVAIRLVAWALAVVLILAALYLSRKAPWQLVRQAAWILVAPAVVLAAYGTPPAWAVLRDLGSTTWTDAVGPFWSRLGPLVRHPLSWGLAFGAVGLWLALPSSTGLRRVQGLACGLIAAGFLAASVPALGGLGPTAFYWVLAAVTVLSAAIAICARSPVYAAIWFALSLAGVSGLFFYNGAQFLGAATIVVYAGAIIVTFLFVIMLAQPEGHATYDRISWASFPQPLSLLAAVALVGALACSLQSSPEAAALQSDLRYVLGKAVDEDALLRADQVAGLDIRIDSDGQASAVISLRGEESAAAVARLQQALAEEFAARKVVLTVQEIPPRRDTLTSQHMANLGGRLFAVHTLSIELAGALLLVALVGAIAIVIHGRQSAPNRPAASQESP